MIIRPDRLEQTVPGFALIVFLAAAFLIMTVFNGLILDDKHLKRRGGKMHRFASKKSPEAIWAEIVPGGGPAGTTGNPIWPQTFPSKAPQMNRICTFPWVMAFFLHRRILFLRKDAPIFVSYEASENVRSTNRDVNAYKRDLRIQANPQGGCTAY
jgi:hypothetical protein